MSTERPETLRELMDFVRREYGKEKAELLLREMIRGKHEEAKEAREGR